MRKIGLVLLTVVTSLALFSSCSSDKIKNEAKESASKYWLDKAYPGKGYDIQVVEASKGDDGLYHVKGIVDGETRIGVYDPKSETFSEGYYSLAHERGGKIAELQEDVKYWKQRADDLEKENYKLKVQLSMLQPGSAAPAPAASPSAKPN